MDLDIRPLHGWVAYRKILRALQRECGVEGAQPLQLRPDAPRWHPDEVATFIEAIPDLSRGHPSLGDVFAALEWQRTLVPLLEEDNLGNMTLIDFRGLNKNTWKSDPGLYSVKRYCSAPLHIRPRMVYAAR